QNANGKAAENVATKQCSVTCLDALTGKDVLKFKGCSRWKIKREIFPHLTGWRLLPATHKRIGEARNGDDGHLYLVLILEQPGKGTHMLRGTRCVYRDVTATPKQLRVLATVFQAAHGNPHLDPSIFIAAEYVAA